MFTKENFGAMRVFDQKYYDSHSFFRSKREQHGKCDFMRTRFPKELTLGYRPRKLSSSLDRKFRKNQEEQIFPLVEYPALIRNT